MPKQKCQGCHRHFSHLEKHYANNTLCHNARTYLLSEHLGDVPEEIVFGQDPSGNNSDQGDDHYVDDMGGDTSFMEDYEADDTPILQPHPPKQQRRRSDRIQSLAATKINT